MTATHDFTLSITIEFDPDCGKTLAELQAEFLDSLTAKHTHNVAIVEGLVDDDDVPVQPRSQWTVKA